MPTIWISGASSDIAQALIAQLSQDASNQLVAISRHALSFESANIHVCQLDLAQPQLSVEQSEALEKLLEDYPPDVVFACQGILHDEQHGPEKNLSQLSWRWFQQSLQVNLWSHLQLAQRVAPVVSRGHSVRWLSLSAMVGSIEDNRLGGWYSYRMSKAALNMFVKNLSLEWHRKNPQSCVVAVHPGTSDTALSKPFQANIAGDKLYSAETTAARMIAIMEQLSPSDSGALYHWDGSRLPW